MVRTLARRGGGAGDAVYGPVPVVMSQDESPAPEPLVAVNSGGVTIEICDVFRP